MAKFTKKSADGTSFHGTTINTTANKLKKLFPNSFDENGDKTNLDFTLETENGDVFTIYDWKNYGGIPMDTPIVWNLGGNNKEITEQAKIEVLAMLKAFAKFNWNNL